MYVHISIYIKSNTYTGPCAKSHFGLGPMCNPWSKSRALLGVKKTWQGCILSGLASSWTRTLRAIRTEGAFAVSLCVVRCRGRAADPCVCFAALWCLGACSRNRSVLHARRFSHRSCFPATVMSHARTRPQSAKGRNFASATPLREVLKSPRSFGRVIVRDAVRLCVDSSASNGLPSDGTNTAAKTKENMMSSLGLGFRV